MSRLRRLLLLAILGMSMTALLWLFSSSKTIVAQRSTTVYDEAPDNSQAGSLHSKTSDAPDEAPRAVRTRSRDQTLTRHSPSTEPDPNVSRNVYLSTSGATVTQPELVTGQPTPDTTAYDHAAQHTKGSTVRHSTEPSRTAGTTLPPKTTSRPNQAPYKKALSVRPGKLGIVNEGDRCCEEVAGIAVEEVCHSWTESGSMPAETIDLHSNCSCVDFLYCKLVVLAGITADHYDEAQDMIAGFQHQLPNTRIIVYDLGLADNQRTELEKECNIEVRTFQYSKYPSHVSHALVKQYAWKPLIVNEVAEEYEVICYGDASARISGSFKPVFPLLLKFPFMAGSAYDNLPIISMTKDESMHYMKFPYTRKQSGFFGHIESGLWVLWVNRLMRTRVLESWVDCALHHICIAPPGSVINPCDYPAAFRHDGPGRFVGCHRFDQSALSLILIREFGLGVWNLAVHPERTSIFFIERWVSHHNVIKRC